jgi:hypothetical protein
MSEETKVIECTQSNPWDGKTPPQGYVIEHDNVETKENDCFRSNLCRNCGYRWIEEFSW